MTHPFPPAENRNPLPASGTRSIHVLVVDDSAVVRQVLGAVLSQEPGIQVTTAADPYIAMDRMKKKQPDVIVLDLELPRMHGLTFLEKIMKENPLPVVILTGLSNDRTDAALRAMEIGAIDIVTKPKIGVKDFLYESAVILIDAVKSASRARLSHRFSNRLIPQARLSADAVIPPLMRNNLTDSASMATLDKIVALGASTGGTEALEFILRAMPPVVPGMVIVQHMPEIFTAAFAKRLDKVCQVQVKEASHEDRVLAGQVLISPGNRHMTVVRTGNQYAVKLIDGPLVSRHRPSVDVLFRSVAKAAGKNAIGVIMTGMGDDGAEGLLEMKQAGAVTLAQDESSCVVFGMPKEAIDRGAAEEICPLKDIPEAILKTLSPSPPIRPGTSISARTFRPAQ